MGQGLTGYVPLFVSGPLGSTTIVQHMTFYCNSVDSSSHLASLFVQLADGEALSLDLVGAWDVTAHGVVLDGVNEQFYGVEGSPALLAFGPFSDGFVPGVPVVPQWLALSVKWVFQGAED
jgi:hypothetical protein